MKVEELRKRLQQVGVSEFLYNLDGTGRNDERFCLQKCDGNWNVYFCERGIKTTNEFFDSEEMACQFIFEQLSD